jgi:uroporphyrinogen III methyltransferase/synthase
MSGKVMLVGAGPGDPGLLTARALEAIASADVILHDRLIPATALSSARADALIIDVGKTGGGEQVPQAETERLMLQHANDGKVVVRLKGGDPFVFGRGGEEALLCHELGIRFEVVPGVTAGIAAPAFAGIPVTQRGVANAVAFVTGATDEGAVNWEALAAFPGTLVIYMGVSSLEQVAEQLISAGRPMTEPAVVIERGTLPSQFVVRSILSEVGKAAATAGVRAPAVVVIGPVGSLSEDLDWINSGPLAGEAVVVTRTPEQASPLAEQLRDLGARVIDAPAITIEPLDAEIPDLAPYDLLVLTSPNGVRVFFERLSVSRRDSRALAGLRVAVVGPGTAAALREHGIEPDVVPERAVGEALAESLAGVQVTRALVARAQEAREVVPDALRAMGAEVDVLALYRTVAAELDEQTRSAVLAADWAIFASASAATHFVAAAGGQSILELSGLKLVSIGPATTAALREAGLEPTTEAIEHTPDGLVQALVQKVGS